MAQFEGIVESRNLTTDEFGTLQEYKMTMWVKNGSVRIHTVGEGISSTTMIYRNDMQIIWMLNDEEKIYFEISQKDEVQEIRPSYDGPEDRHRVKQTGRKRTILGYPCEQVIISRGGEQTELWGTTRLKKLANALELALGEDARAGEAWTEDVKKLGLYTLKSTTKIDGTTVESQEVIRIEEAKLADTLFVVPAEYVKQTFEEMLDGMTPRSE